MNPDITDVLRKFSDGVTPVDYRFAAAWRTGIIIGSAVMAEIPHVVIRAEPRDHDVSYVYERGSRWVQAVDPLFELWRKPLGIEYGTRFVLVRPEDVREKVSAVVMSKRPHKCPKCGCPALIMTTSVSCTWWSCKNYDARA